MGPRLEPNTVASPFPFRDTHAVECTAGRGWVWVRRTWPHNAHLFPGARGVLLMTLSHLIPEMGGIRSYRTETGRQDIGHTLLSRWIVLVWKPLM